MAKLEDLIRQRELMAGHLEWLDGEIAALRGQAPSPAPLAPPPRAPAAPCFPQPETPQEAIAASIHRHSVTPTGQPPEIPDAVTEEFLAQYQSDSKSSPQDAKKGCLILFCSVVGLFCVTLLIVYFVKYS